ncbi:hypothetical protein AB1L42_13460 [Thalassoglobus sp. JC818]|uniref:hypothetical protein n=1 Tax=Thalassoglobus sp. JC818 TaxID=3232136 RepID=UPI00345811C1
MASWLNQSQQLAQTLGFTGVILNFAGFEILGGVVGFDVRQLIDSTVQETSNRIDASLLRPSKSFGGVDSLTR